MMTTVRLNIIEIARGEAVDGGKAVVHLYDYKPPIYKYLGEEDGSRL
jgi:hypothetical protein